MSGNIGMEKEVTGDFDEVVTKTIEALKSEGFGVLTRIDVHTILKEKIDVDFEKYVILGACNPTLAHKALTKTRNIGLLLPCNVIVYEKEPNTIVVSMINPKVMEDVLPDVDLAEVSGPAAEKLTSALGKI